MQGLDKVRAMHKAVAEGYPVHIGCGGECDDRGEDGYQCHKCGDSMLPEDDVVGTWGDYDTGNVRLDGFVHDLGGACDHFARAFKWVHRGDLRQARRNFLLAEAWALDAEDWGERAGLLPEPPDSGPLSHDRDLNLDHEEF